MTSDPLRQTDSRWSIGFVNATDQPLARRPRRRLLLPIVVAAAVFLGLFGAGHAYTVLATKTVPFEMEDQAIYQAAYGMPNTVWVAVWWPDCVKLNDYGWLTPDVADLPWSVTVTLRMNDHYAAECKSGIIGIYLSQIGFPVQLSEPVGNRPFLDGSTFPAAKPSHHPLTSFGQ